MTEILPIRLLLNAEPFGFGPSAAIAAFFPFLRPHFEKIGYLGKKHTLDLQKDLAYDALHDMTGTPKYRRREAYADVFSRYDVLLTAMDHKVAEAAQAAGLKVYYYDALTWYWPRIPSAAQKSDLYIAQDFWGVRERLARDFAHDAPIECVPPIVAIPERAQEKDCVLINVGGLQNPFWPVEEAAIYARCIIDAARAAIPSSEKVIIAASEGVAQRLNDPAVKTYARAEIEPILARAKRAFMTPGLGNIYDAAAYDVPTVWLPPANDSQGLQLRLLRQHGLVDGFMDWSSIGHPIDYSVDQPEILTQMARAASRVAHDKGCQGVLSATARDQYGHVEPQERSRTRILLRRFGQNGAKHAASSVVEHASSAFAPETYFSLPAGLTGRLRSPYRVAHDPAARLQLRAYVPGLQFLEARPETLDLTLEHTPSVSPRLEENGPRVTLFASDDEPYPADISHLLYGIVRRELLQRGCCVAHAACVGKNGVYSLIVGHSGSGKTTLAQRLIDRCGYDLFSGNATVLRFEGDNLMAIAGTSTMTALDKEGVRRAYELPSSSCAAPAPVRIASIALVRLNDGVYETATLTMPSALHTLYPYFMDSVNADIIVNGKDLFDGAPSSETRSRMIRDMARVLPTLPVRKAAGSLRFLERAVVDLTR
jgi:hypothetical protein